MRWRKGREEKIKGKEGKHQQEAGLMGSEEGWSKAVISTIRFAPDASGHDACHYMEDFSHILPLLLHCHHIKHHLSPQNQLVGIGGHIIYEKCESPQLWEPPKSMLPLLPHPSKFGPVDSPNEATTSLVHAQHLGG